MFAFGKVVFDPGHGLKVNAGPNGYYEGDAMLKLGLMLKTKGFELTKEDGSDPSLPMRVQRAKELGANTIISLHTDWVPPDNPQATEQTMVIYSLNRPGDKQIAEYLANEIAAAIGVNRTKTWTRHAPSSTPEKPIDYYGILRYAVDLGIEHAFIVEHCNHAQMSVDTENKLRKIADCYEKILKGAGTMNPIMGEAQASAYQMDTFLRKINPDAPDVAHIYLEEGEIEGVRGDIAFAQALKETNYFKFTGIAKPEWHNPAGLGVTGAKDANGNYIGNKFPDWCTGIRAQIQHLKAYASKEPLKQPCVDQRFHLVTRGVAPNWEDLNGRWAVPGTTYGQDIIRIWKKLLEVPDKTPNIATDDIHKEIAAIKKTIQNMQNQINSIKEYAKKISEV